MQTVLTILITVLMFGVLIFVHELGHFLTAKWAKVKVNEFALGMGPRILKKQGKETLYSLRALPIGGFVQMDGEDGNGTDENSFNNKPKWKRFIILFAGAFNNLIFGFLLICLVHGLLSGVSAYPTTVIDQFHDDAISFASGLQPGDTIYAIDGYRIFSYTDIGYACSKNGTEPLTFTVQRDGKKVEINDVVFPVVTTDYAGDFFTVDFYVEPASKNLFSTIKYSFESTISLSRSIYSFFGSLFTGGESLKNVTGVVGVTQVIGDTVATEKGIDFYSLFLMMAMISINLGVVNLLPFPALDGGRILLLAIEAVFRRKLSEKVEVAINTIGLALLMLLMVVITVKDVINLF